jgi:hypothetical protein
MDKENMGHIHNGVLVMRKFKMMLFSGKWKELDIVILSKISQSHKIKYHTFLSYTESKFKMITMVLIMMKIMIIIIILEHEYKAETVGKNQREEEEERQGTWG